MVDVGKNWRDRGVVVLVKDRINAYFKNIFDLCRERRPFSW
jgi:hypothetical protein